MPTVFRQSRGDFGVKGDLRVRLRNIRADLRRNVSLRARTPTRGKVPTSASTPARSGAGFTTAPPNHRESSAAYRPVTMCSSANSRSGRRPISNGRAPTIRSRRAGWATGAGAEIALVGNWRAGAEYLYVVDLGGSSFRVAGLQHGLRPSVLRIGINYRF